MAKATECARPAFAALRLTARGASPLLRSTFARILASFRIQPLLGSPKAITDRAVPLLALAMTLGLKIRKRSQREFTIALEHRWESIAVFGTRTAIPFPDLLHRWHGLMAQRKYR
jgi:hypothetical protein